MPSIFNSPWILGARHNGLAAAISSIRRRISTAVAGLPRRRRFLLDKRAQNLRNRSRCHRTTVSAWTYIRGERQRFHSRESPTQNSPSREVRTGRRLSLEGRELKAESSILRRHGRMTAEEESRKTEQGQGEGRHRPRFLDHMLMKVKPLSENRILANHNCV